MSVYAVLIIFLISDVVVTLDAASYASLSSDDGNFKLQWTYNNSKLFFKMTCKTTGWCAVGFTKTGDGKNMVNYDIAVAGFASGAGYIDVSCNFVFISWLIMYLKPRPNDRNMPTQHIATLLPHNMLCAFDHCVATCWMLLVQI